MHTFGGGLGGGGGGGRFGGGGGGGGGLCCCGSPSCRKEETSMGVKLWKPSWRSSPPPVTGLISPGKKHGFLHFLCICKSDAFEWIHVLNTRKHGYC